MPALTPPAALLIAAGDNPQRLHSEASIAALRGACPVEASSGRTVRHRLNRGGDRQANNTLRRIATVRLRCDQQTNDYATRRRAEGNNDREIIRSLKRYIAREIYRLLTDPPVVPHGADLRQQRQLNAMTLDTAAAALNAWPTRISHLDRPGNSRSRRCRSRSVTVSQAVCARGANCNMVVTKGVRP